MTDFEMMDDSGENFKPRSLSTNLIRWFLVMGLCPLMFVATISFIQANKSLIEMTEEGLQLSSDLSVQFIENWFDYRHMDLKIQSESLVNAKLLQQLSNGFNKSNQGLSEYAQSAHWANIIERSDNNLVNMVQKYDYISDLLLIDNKGNILYTVAQNNDLGTNLNHGVYAQTNLFETFTKTIESDKIQFSGFERYSPLQKKITGFLTAIILNEGGEKIGVIAARLRPDRLFNLLNAETAKGESLKHFLINEKGLLLSSLSSDSHQDVLNRTIKLDPLNRNLKGKPLHGKSTISAYDGAAGYRVFGINQKLNIQGVDWTLVTEISRDDALYFSDWLKVIMIPLVFVVAVLVFGLAVFIARRIIRPIKELEEASVKIAAGHTNQHVDVFLNDEIGRLSVSFNHMTQMREIHEQSLKQRSRESQQALSELAEQKYALDQHAIVAITDIQGNITFVNDKFSEVSGYTKSELMGQNHRMVNSGFHRKEFFIDMYDQISSGNVWNAEVCNRAKSGRLYWVDTTIIPFVGENGPESYIAIRTDITERKKTEDDLIEARIDAEAAVAAKSEFLASMSHEIRTPMNGVLGMLGLLLNTKLSAEQKHRAKIAQSSAESLLTLINDILDFSKVEAGKLELEMLDFKLHDMLGNFVEAMALQAQTKGVELVLDLTGVENTIVKGDPGRLRQILTNLVSNAIKFTQEGEVVIRAELLDVGPNDWRFQVSITDTGIGIPEKKLAMLFDAFSQVDTSTTRKYGGTGLGLSIVKKLCALMDGEIKVTSEEGNGSCFEVDVQLMKSMEAQQVLPEVDIQALSFLVVDDNKTNREVLRSQFEIWGASVVEAESSEEALEICEQRSEEKGTKFFDIALLDMQLPGMNGDELGRTIKNDMRYKEMKLVMMTSIGSQGDAKYFADLGFSAYFPKPATTADLFDALAVISEDGYALQQAQPLVTRHYLKSLEREGFDEHRFDSNIGHTKWPKGSLALLVEDNQINQMVATGILRGFGLDVMVAANGLEALELLGDESHRFNIVLMDCEMPQMDGYETTQNIRSGNGGAHYKELPIIAMTANVMDGIRNKCIDAGMNDYLAKPIDPDLLLDKLKEWVLKDTVKNQESNDTEVQQQEETEYRVWEEETALRRVMGDEVLLNTVIDVFLNESPRQVESIQVALDDQDCEQVRKLTHSLKGVSANIAGIVLQHQAMLMEEAATKVDMDKLNELMPELKRAHLLLLNCFKEYQARVAADDVEKNSEFNFSAEELSRLLQDLERKLSDSEYIDPRDLEPLKHYQASLQSKKFIKELIAQISQFDNEVAKETLQKIKEAESFEL